MQHTRRISLSRLSGSTNRSGFGKFKRALIGSAALALAAFSVPQAQADFVIFDSTSLFAPSFRGASNSTYFGWSSGTWDSDPADSAAVGGVGNDNERLNPFPTVNFETPQVLRLHQIFGGPDLVSGSNNVYSSVGGINASGLSLDIPTLGTVGEGFTTIIIQGKGLGGAAFGGSGALDTFAFGEIDGVAPTYIYGVNRSDVGQWWAKWELPGNEALYSVDITGYDNGVGVLSVTDLSVDATWSPTAHAADTAQLVPEPSAVLTLLGGLSALLFARRRTRSLTAAAC